MSHSESPVRTMFDIQRTAIRQGQQMVKQGLAFQRSSDMAALTGVRGQESLQRQSLELLQAAFHGYVDVTTAMLDMGGRREQHQAIDETFMQLKDTHAQLFDAVEQEFDRGVRAFDELSGEYIDAIDEQTEQVLESQQIVEDQAAQNFDEFTQQLHDQFERIEEMQDQLDAQFEEQTERTERLLQRQTEQAEKFQRQLKEDAEEMQRQLRQQAEATQRDESTGTGGEQTITIDSEHEPTSESENQLEHIEGLGPTFRDRLQEAGIETIDDLADADAETVATAAEVSEDRAQDWIDRARP